MDDKEHFMISFADPKRIIAGGVDDGFHVIAQIRVDREWTHRLSVIKPDNPCYIKLANTRIILNTGGGPIPDKPEVVLERPLDFNRVNSYLNLRVADIWACYK